MGRTMHLTSSQLPRELSRCYPGRSVPGPNSWGGIVAAETCAARPDPVAGFRDLCHHSGMIGEAGRLKKNRRTGVEVELEGARLRLDASEAVCYNVGGLSNRTCAVRFLVPGRTEGGRLWSPL